MLCEAELAVCALYVTATRSTYATSSLSTKMHKMSSKSQIKLKTETQWSNLVLPFHRPFFFYIFFFRALFRRRGQWWCRAVLEGQQNRARAFAGSYRGPGLWSCLDLGLGLALRQRGQWGDGSRAVAAHKRSAPQWRTETGSALIGGTQGSTGLRHKASPNWLKVKSVRSNGAAWWVEKPGVDPRCRVSSTPGLRTHSDPNTENVSEHPKKLWGHWVKIQWLTLRFRPNPSPKGASLKKMQNIVWRLNCLFLWLLWIVTANYTDIYFNFSLF